MKKEILKQYYELLCQGDYPSFIDHYLKAPELKRLKYIGQFYGCDYGIYSSLFFYSRYDHSIATAYSSLE